MIPIRDENPSGTIPIVTQALIAVNVGLFLYELMIGPQGISEFFMRWGLVPARFTYALHEGGEPVFQPGLTFFTSMFLHGNWAHLLGNMWFLWIFGDNIEDSLGRTRYLLFYLAAGLAASAIQYATHPDSRVPTVGASGAIAGVLGGYAVLYPGARVHTFLFIRIVPLPAVLVLGLWFVLQFFSGALALGAGVQGGVAWWAHIGGFVFGMLAVPLLARRRRETSRAWVDS